MTAPTAQKSYPTTSFAAIGTHITIVASDALAMTSAVRIAREVLAGLDLAASRFRPDSELVRLNRLAVGGDLDEAISPMLTAAVQGALRTAHLTDGLVDPTIGAALEAAGYDEDLDAVRAREPRAAGAPRPATGYRRLQLDVERRRLRVPQGTVLDLGASAKALAADLIAQRLGAGLPGGFLVDLGGDIAIGGRVPTDGWQLGVELADGSLAQVITTTGQAVATSSTQLRVWRTDTGRPQHHILDPRTGEVAQPVWAQVTACAASALEANAATTAAIIHGADAPAWLAGIGIPALLIPTDGSAPVRVAGWPEKE